MDWVVWLIGGVVLIGIIVGVYRGALRIAVSIVAAVLTIVIVVFATPYAAQIVEEKTPIYESVKSHIEESMTNMAKEMLEEKIEDEAEEISEETKEEISDEIAMDEEIPRDTQIKMIETAELPAVFKNLLTENNNDEIYQELGVETFVQYVGSYLSKLMIRVGIFLLLFVLVTIILRAIVFALNIVNGIPVFGIMNRLAGGFVGIVCSFLVIWCFFILVILCYSTDVGKQIYDAVIGNDYTRIIFENNPLLNISIKF